MRAARHRPRRVAIVEDNPATRAHLVDIVSQLENTELASASDNVKDALRSIKQWRPDIVLCDLGLPDGSGVEVIHYAAALDIPCMVVTVMYDEATVIRAIEAGASGYLLKDQPAKLIGQAILDLLAGGSPLTPSIASYLLRRINGAPRSSRSARLAADPLLSKRETEVLNLAAQGYRAKEIAQKLSLSPHTVANHQRNVYRKLSVKNKSEAVAVAVKKGFIDR